MAPGTPWINRPSGAGRPTARPAPVVRLRPVPDLQLRTVPVVRLRSAAAALLLAGTLLLSPVSAPAASAMMQSVRTAASSEPAPTGGAPAVTPGRGGAGAPRGDSAIARDGSGSSNGSDSGSGSGNDRDSARGAHGTGGLPLPDVPRHRGNASASARPDPAPGPPGSLPLTYSPGPLRTALGGRYLPGLFPSPPGKADASGLSARAVPSRSGRASEGPPGPPARHEPAPTRRPYPHDAGRAHSGHADSGHHRTGGSQRGGGGPVPGTAATGSAATGSAAPSPVPAASAAAPGTPDGQTVRPLVDLLPLGSGIVLVGLGLGFLGLRLRHW